MRDRRQRLVHGRFFIAMSALLGAWTPSPRASGEDPPADRDSALQVIARKMSEGFRGLSLSALRAAAGPKGGAADETCQECLRGEVRSTESVKGQLESGDCRLSDGTFLDTWSLELTTRAQVEIELSSTDFDTYLFLTDRDCLVLDNNDDCASAAGGSCLSLILSKGDYFIAANSYGSPVQGNYQLTLRTRPVFRRGDVDINGVFEITDPVQLLNFLFLGGGDPACMDAADFDDSGILDITDAVNNLNYQFLGGTVPSAPGPFNCGPDPTTDELNCLGECQ